MRTGCFFKKTAAQGFFIALFWMFMIIPGLSAKTAAAMDPVEPEVELLPPVFNTISNKKNTVAIIRMPKGYSANDIDESSLLLDDKLLPERVLSSGKSRGSPGRFGKDRPGKRTCKALFSHEEILDLLHTKGMCGTLRKDIAFSLTGRLKDGTPLKGIAVLDRVLWLSVCTDVSYPLHGSVINELQPEFRAGFHYGLFELDLDSFEAELNGYDTGSSFSLTQDHASYQPSSGLPTGENRLDISINDVLGNSGRAESVFNITPSDSYSIYYFTIEDVDGIFKSPGDGTYRHWVTYKDLGIKCSEINALYVDNDENVYFSLKGKDLVFRSEKDGEKTLISWSRSFGIPFISDIAALFYDSNTGDTYFSLSGDCSIYKSAENGEHETFLSCDDLGMTDGEIKGLHIDSSGNILFSSTDTDIVYESRGDGTNEDFMASTDLGIPGYMIESFARIPDETPPEIRITEPQEGSVLHTRNPDITIEYSDSETGIDPDSFMARINGEDRTEMFTVTQTGAECKSASGLTGGYNEIFASIGDNAGNTASAVSSFRISTLRAIPGANPVSGPAPLTVHFTANGEDPDGTVEQYWWDFDGDGQWDTYDTVARNYNHTYQTPGRYDATLRVRSSSGREATESIEITVENNPPTAEANVVPSNGEIPLTVSLEGTAADPDGSIVLYEWDFDGDGVFDWSSETTGHTTHTYTEEGAYNAVFRATDDTGDTAVAHAATTAVRAGPPGSPTAEAQASPVSGDAPLGVNFSGSGTDPDGGGIVSYEWDFDGDGQYDWSSEENGNTSHTYNSPGTYAARFRVTDSEGLTGIDTLLIKVGIQMNLSIQDSDQTFSPADSETMPIDISLSGDTPARLVIKNQSMEKIRTISLDFPVESPVLWNGKDSDGYTVNDGVYYAVLEYMTDGQWHEYDLTYSTGGKRSSFPFGSGCNRRDSFPNTFEPFEDDFLPLTFRLCTAQKVTAFIGPLNSGGDAARIATIVNQQTFPAGEHTIYWDGLDGNGEVAEPPPGDRLITGFWRYSLPENAMYAAGSRPVITDISADPNYFSPFSEKCCESCNGAGISLNYTVSEDISRVRVKVFDVKNSREVYSATENNIAAGENTFFWNVQNENGEYMDIGDYQVGIMAEDSGGSQSMWRYALVRIDY
ncbi:MAG: PKD domain-containing protein [Desulfobacteraceae bacterium]|nr:PKD domain-containing protein [Desulfobacteraceae bacterium]